MEQSERTGEAPAAGDGATADAGGDPKGESKRDDAGSSSSSSRSRSSSSSRSRSKSPIENESAPKFIIDDHVEVFGLEGEGGRMLNGRKGMVIQFIADQGRYEVSFGPGREVILKPKNLRKCDPPAPKAEAKPKPKAEAPKPMSLASLLGAGKAEEKKPEPETYQSLWQRTGTEVKAGVVTGELQEAIEGLQAAEEDRLQDEAKLREQIVEEFKLAGISDEAMIETAFQEQLAKKREEEKRPPKRRSPSSSSSRSSPSRSRSRSRSRSK